MVADLEFVQNVHDQVRGIGHVSYRRMIREYAVYVGQKVVALVCDNQHKGRKGGTLRTAHKGSKELDMAPPS